VSGAVGAKILCVAIVAAAVVACGTDSKAFDDLESTVSGTDPARPMCNQPTIPEDNAEPGDPIPAVPYPTPAGEQVKPGISGVPLPEGSVQVDGFESGETVVQVFTTDASPNEVFDFYDAVMRDHGWFAGGSGSGVYCDYLSEPRAFGAEPEHWVRVSLDYIPRPGEETAPGEPKPGERPTGFGTEPRTPDTTFFSLITPRR